jgi:anti-sigma factor ChrR (cupin superfamily)
MSRKARDPDAALFGADGLERALAGLALAGAPREPPSGLWGRIAEAMGQPKDLAALGVAALRLDQGRWRGMAPGVEIKPLWGKRTFLLRCQAGATVPAHRHRSFEHTLVLSGDVQTDHGALGPGDYEGVPAGPHASWGTRGGCLVLVQYDP